MEGEGGLVFAQRPDSIRRLRACKSCKLIKTYDQFYSGFCENCPHKRPEGESAGRRDEFVATETTADFEGMVSMMQPSSSWVARWLRMRVPGEDDIPVVVKPGLYAISLPGEEAAIAAARAGLGLDAMDEVEDAYEEEGEEEAEDSGRRGSRRAGDSVGDDLFLPGSLSAGGGRGKVVSGRGASAGAGGGAGSRDDRHDPEAREAAIHQAAIDPDDDDDYS